jgi:hypothetical protein
MSHYVTILISLQWAATKMPANFGLVQNYPAIIESCLPSIVV